MNRDSKILVLGANGLVGGALVNELWTQGFLNVLTPRREDLDLLDTAIVEWYFSVHRPSHVFFAAALVGGISSNIARGLDFLNLNLQMELNVINNAAKYGVGKLLFVSTSCCYPRDCPQPMKPSYLGTGALEPTTEPYAIAKIAGMALCREYRILGRDFNSAMLCNVFGPRDNFDPRNAHCLPGMMARMHKAKLAGLPSFDVWGSGAQQREFIYADDAAAALICAMENHSCVEPINIGTGIELSMKELAIVLSDVLEYSGKLDFDPAQPTGTPRKLMDSSVLLGHGWRPKVDFLYAVRETYDWYKLNYENLQKASSL